MLCTEAPEQAVILLSANQALGNPGANKTFVPMVNIDKRPFLDYLLEYCIRFGFRDLLLVTENPAHRFASYISGARRWLPAGVKLELATVPVARGTAAALRELAPRLNDRFLLLNGQSLFDFNWLDLMLGTTSSGRPLAVAAVRRTSANETVSGGVVLIDKQILSHLTDAETLERALLPGFAFNGLVTLRDYEGFFVDVGVPAGLALARAKLAQRRNRAAVFFDRDGTLNLDIGYVYRTEDLVFLPGAVAAVKRVNDLGCYAFLVTNQSGVARGYFAEADVEAFHAHMQRLLRAAGAHFDDIRFCPYHPDGTVTPYARHSDWRKPASGMFVDLMKAWPVIREASFVVGDTESDMQAADAAGLRGVRYHGGDLDRLIAAHVKP